MKFMRQIFVLAAATAPALAFAVRRHVEMLKKHQEVGFTGILLKPVTVDKLRDIVK